MQNWPLFWSSEINNVTLIAEWHREVLSLIYTTDFTPRKSIKQTQTSSLFVFCFHRLLSFHLLLLHTHLFFVFFNTQAQTEAKTKQRCIKVHNSFLQMRKAFTPLLCPLNYSYFSPLPVSSFHFFQLSPLFLLILEHSHSQATSKRHQAEHTRGTHYEAWLWKTYLSFTLTLSLKLFTFAPPPSVVLSNCSP